MSREYHFIPIHGIYPCIKQDVRDDHRHVQLVCDEYSTEFHLHFEDAWKEWNDHAETVFMEDIIANAKD